jgi:NADH-quinone oxidoreductase subunit N
VITITPQEIRALAPEIILLVFAAALLLTRPNRAASTIVGLAGAIAAFLALDGLAAPAALFHAAYETGPETAFLKSLAVVAAAVGILLIHGDRRVTDHHPEILALALLSVSGVLLLVSARHLAFAYVAFELISVPSYALVGSTRGDSRSAEGGVKYAIFGGAASGLLLYGMSLLYGASGSLLFSDIAGVLAESPLAVAGAVLVAAGILYKLAAAPFHYWCPDAFEAAPTSIAGFLSIAPKIGGFGLLIALSAVFAGNPAWAPLLSTAAIFSMLLGNLAAIPQENVPRLLAYSSIAHGGYILIGAAAQSHGGDFAILFYLTVYLFMNLGAFFIAGIVGRGGSIDAFRGLGKRSPFTAFCMAVFLFSLTGLPPFGGFIGKMFLITSALGMELYTLIVVLVFASVVSLYVYARILRTMYFDAPATDEPLQLDHLTEAVLAFLAAAVLVLGVWWGPVGKMAGMAAGIW